MYPIIDFLTGRETLLTTTQYMTQQRKAGKNQRIAKMLKTLTTQPLPVVDFLGD